MKEQTVVRFINEDKNTEFAPDAVIDHSKPELEQGTLKFCTKKRLTDAEYLGTLVFTTDTGEFYVGTGYDSFIKKISDLFIGLKSEFPVVGAIDKLYCAVDEKAMYYWDKTRYVRFTTLNTQLYQDIFEVGEESTTSFQLRKMPLNNIMSMNINGLNYYPDDFSYDIETNTITWNKTGEKGFDIANSKVVFEYEILRDITIKPPAVSQEENVQYYRPINSLKMSSDKAGKYSITYKGQDVLMSKKGMY